MVKTLLVAVWICAVTLGSSFAATYWKIGHSAPAAAHSESPGGLEYRKTKPLNVPMIADGGVQGYVVAQFVYTADAAKLKDLPVPPEVFLLDQAFRSLYSDEKLDFRHLEKYDLTKLTKELVKSVDERLNSDVVKDVLVQEFNYVSKDDMKR